MRKSSIDFILDDEPLDSLSDAERKVLYRDAKRLADAVGASWLYQFRRGRLDSTLNYTQWDAVTGEFIIYGQRIRAEDIRQILAHSERLLERKLSKLVNQLEQGKITFNDFKRAFERLTRSQIIFAAALATGGIAIALNSPFVRKILAEQKAFLKQTLTTGIIEEVLNLTEEQDEERQRKRRVKIRNRLKAYLRRGHVTFEGVRQRIFETLGIYTMARRHLRPAEHCIPCVEWADKGWMPISEMPPIGAFKFEDGGCYYNCRCWIEYK